MQRAKRKPAEQGLTLIECLVAIMVAATIVTAITPPLLIAFATRVQNYKADQAMKLAQAEINRVRSLVDSGNYTSNWTQQLPPAPTQTGAFDRDLDSVPAPTPISSATEPPPCPLTNVLASTERTVWCGEDINGDGKWDLGVQAFRSNVPPDTAGQVNGQPIAFLMGVRVYTKTALTSPGSRLLSPPRRRTTSLGLTEGESLSLPLVTRYETIVRSDLPISSFAYCELSWRTSTGGSGTSPCNF